MHKESCPIFKRTKKRSGTSKIMLAFSGGKDSICAALYCLEKFEEVVPYYAYIIPDLDFVEENLRYYEERLFGKKVLRVPHPCLSRWLDDLLYQSPDSALVYQDAKLPRYDLNDLADMVRIQEGLAATIYHATGVRMTDAPFRRVALQRYGPISEKLKKVHIIWNWRQQRVYDEIEGAGLTLSNEYVMMGRSLAGIDIRFLKPIKEHHPKDYAKIVDWFPLIDAELWRYERGSHA